MIADFGESLYGYRLKQVRELCSELGLAGGVHLIGCSFGGALAAELASSPGLDVPVRSFVNISGTRGLFRVEAEFAGLNDFGFEWKDAERITQLLVNSPVGLDGHIDRRHSNSRNPGHWEVLMASRLRSPKREPTTRVDFLAQLGGVNCPALYIEGENDRLLETGWSKSFVRATPGSRNVLMRSGHEPNIDKAGELTDILLEFLESC